MKPNLYMVTASNRFHAHTRAHTQSKPEDVSVCLHDDEYTYIANSYTRTHI